MHTLLFAVSRKQNKTVSCQEKESDTDGNNLFRSIIVKGYGNMFVCLCFTSLQQRGHLGHEA